MLPGPHPTDRGKAGSKYHLLVDATGLPLNVLVSGANRHDSLFVEPLLDSMPAIRIGGRGHPRRRPVKLHGDKGYDTPRVRRYDAWYRHITLACWAHAFLAVTRTATRDPKAQARTCTAS